MFKRLTDTVEKKLYGDTSENINKKMQEAMENFDPEDLIQFKGKHISVLPFANLEQWEDLDDLVERGYEILGCPSHGMYGTSSYILLRNPLSNKSEMLKNG